MLADPASDPSGECLCLFRNRQKGASSRHENGVNDSTERLDEETTIDELSPELALVDADLALIARSRMPDRPGFSATVAPESVPSVGEVEARSDPLNGGRPPPRTLRTAIAAAQSPSPAATVASGDERSVIASAPAGTHFVVGVGAAGARRNGEAVDESPAFSEGGPARRWSPLPALVSGLLLALAALALAATRLTGDRGPSDRVATSVAAAPGAALQAEKRPRTNGRRVAPPSSREPPPAAHAAPGRPARRERSSPAAAQPAPGRPARRQRSSPPAAAEPAPGRPARRQGSSPPASVFVWLPVRGASHYKVEFFRGGRRVFQATTAKARLELPRRWTFKGRRFAVTPGTYRWSVRPGFGAGSSRRYGETIVASRWTVRARS
jgi:hypothetical protein